MATFLGSIYNFKGYTTYYKRSGGSLFAQFLLLVVICCGLYASITTTWFTANISPFLDEMAVQVPAISVKDGKATVDIEQPYFYKIEGETVAIVDTTQPAEKYLEEYDAVMVLSEDKFFIKDDTLLLWMLRWTKVIVCNASIKTCASGNNSIIDSTG